MGMTTRTTLCLGAVTIPMLGGAALFTKNILIPNLQSYAENVAERSQYEHDLFDRVIRDADRNNNGVLELAEASRMLDVIGYNHSMFYGGQALYSVTYSSDEASRINYYGSNSISISLNVSDLEKYVQKEMPGIHREGIPGVMIEKSM